MTSKVQLDRDVISAIYRDLIYGIFFAKIGPDLSDFKLGLVSKKCFLALKTACGEECKGVWLTHLGLRLTNKLHYIYDFSEISEPVFLLLKELIFCELKFDMYNDQRYLQLLRKIKGFDLKRIHFELYFVSDPDIEFFDPDHRSEMMRIISESSGTLKELLWVPDIFLPHLPHTLKLEELIIGLNSIQMDSNIKGCLQLSAKKVEIFVDDCYLPSHLLKDTNAQTLHVFADRFLAEGVEENSVEIQANPSIQEISISLKSLTRDIPDKIYDIKKIIENIQKGYPNLILLEIQDTYDTEHTYSYELPRKDCSNFQFFTKLFMKTEALLSELQDLSFSIKIEQAFDAPEASNYIDIANEISSLRKDKLKDFEEVQDDPRAEDGHEYLSLKKLIQFGEAKSLEVTFYTSSRKR